MYQIYSLRKIKFTKMCIPGVFTNKEGAAMKSKWHGEYQVDCDLNSVKDKKEIRQR